MHYFKPLTSKFNKPKKPQVNLKEIKQFFRIFINCVVPNPEFSNQSKTKLTAPNVKVNVLTKNINTIFKWSFAEEINDIIKGKELLTLKKTEKKKKFIKIDGFDPANNAGGKDAKDCTLILCEGLSAKTYAVVGIEVGFNNKKGRDWFGIYPLRGKLLNVRNATVTNIAKNKEITDVVQALGLKYGVDYTKEKNFNILNYGKVMIMTDADYDGIHISSLIMNLFHSLFPSLLERDEAFITSMQTPIVKVFLPRKELAFYNEYNFNEFKRKNVNRSYKIKYYKGLGTSSDKEVRETFGQRVIEYIADENISKTMDKAFHSKKSDLRKTWLEEFNVNNIIIDNEEPGTSLMDFSDYLDTELIKFSIDDCKRSIPNIFDGLKESHRKILYGVFLKNLKPGGKSMKVAQLAGSVAENTNYHHGEQCLFETITKMAQDFPGSNNIPYLFPDGQFGSRLSGGKDAANARYIFTKLTKLTRLIFRPEDDVLLKYIEDDGDKVEPEFYIPILPMILINGCTAGIGTGWSCSVPCYNPLDIIKCIKIWLDNDGNIYDKKGNNILPDLIPWYRKHKGEIKKIDKTKFASYGNFIENKGKCTIDELPVNMWTDKFKNYLDDLVR